MSLTVSESLLEAQWDDALAVLCYSAAQLRMLVSNMGSASVLHQGKKLPCSECSKVIHLVSALLCLLSHRISSTYSFAYKINFFHERNFQNLLCML